MRNSKSRNKFPSIGMSPVYQSLESKSRVQSLASPKGRTESKFKWESNEYGKSSQSKLCNMCDLFLYNVSCIWQLVWKASSQKYLICMIIPCWIQLTLKLYSAIYSWLFRKLSQSLLSFYMMCEIKDIEHYTLSSVTTPHTDRGVRGIFFRGGKVSFPDFFLGVKYDISR